MTAPEEASLRLRRLRRDVESDRAAMAARALELQSASRAAGDAAQHAVMAMALHHYYTALESALERLIRFADGGVPSGSDWHGTLLREAARELPGVRPAILEVGLLPDLLELLRFRHFFRHAYAVALDRDRLSDLADRVARVNAAVMSALERYTAGLEVAAERLRGAGSDREP